MGAVTAMAHKGWLHPGVSVLDIGTSNLYGADSSAVAAFLSMFQPDLDATYVSGKSVDLAAGSGKDAAGQNLNEAFVGELFDLAGVHYESIDVAMSYKTTFCDLNRQELPSKFKNEFDCVMNFGTSEHILNQYAVFKAVHDACKAGGLMMHSVPCVGFSDHGYFTYTSRFFFDLAGWNKYEIEDYWLDYTDASEDLLAGPRAYATYFPYPRSVRKWCRANSARECTHSEPPNRHAEGKQETVCRTG